jgi:hypothetical protein
MPPPVSALFKEDEAVLESHALLPGIAPPQFGQRDQWEFHAHPRPANVLRGDWKAVFDSADPVWNLRIRELLMIMLNPEHPAVIARSPHRATRKPCKVIYAIQIGRTVRQLSDWARQQALPSDLRFWDADIARAYIEQCRARLRPKSLTMQVLMVRKLHQLGPHLTGGGLAEDPWPGKSAQQVAEVAQAAVTTENVDPQMWFAVIRAAWTYVHDFAPDILAARNRLQSLQQQSAATMSVEEFEQRLEAFLSDPANKVPVHRGGRFAGRVPIADGSVNMRMLCLLLGVQAESGAAGLLRSAEGAGVRWLLQRALDGGRSAPGGLSGVCATVTRPDGTSGPWHPGMGPREMGHELIALRNACYTITAGLSMMRDSEIREITRNSVVEHYGSPAVVSRKHKADENVPMEHWWIADPVAEAIAVAEEVSWHDELIFTGVRHGGLLGSRGSSSSGTFSSGRIVQDFIEHVNRGSQYSGLSIPLGRSTPQQFRKTMAMLTARQPGGEIAVHHQLKHVAVRAMANRVTEGYWASDGAWAKLLDTALEDVRIERLSDLYADHIAGRPIGFGPAAEKLGKAFDAVREQAERLRSTGKARHGDKRVEFDLLRAARISIRFGTLNHCTLDERNPVGAKCLEAGLKLPDGHTGPVQNLCQPGRCANSLIRSEHLPVYQAERGRLLTLLENPRLSPPQRGALQQQLDEVTEVIARTEL